MTTRNPMTFHFSWKVAVLAILCCAITVRLGFWQLDRAEQKQRLIQEWTSKSQAPHAPLADIVAAFVLRDAKQLNSDHAHPLHYQRVYWQGYVDNQRTFLLDNRMRGPKAGFEVLTPIQIASTWVLLNRGWVEKKPRHYDLPEFPMLNEAEGYGHVYIPGKSMVLANSKPTDEWPKIIQSIDFDMLSASLGQPLLPFTVRAESSDNNALNIDWPGLALNPDKNIGYAVQWFGIGIALLIGFIASGVRRPSAGKIEPEG